MQNSIKEIGNEKCTGCGLCSAVCPTNAIKMGYNGDGFYIPSLDNRKCISCGICKKGCIKFEKDLKETSIKKVFATKAKNKDVLKKSTSGGASYELMKACIKQGYSIVGVAYDYEKEQAVTMVENNLDKLEKYYGSKYMQSLTEEAFKKVIKDNPGQKYAIFSTPCHIYSLNKYSEVKNNRDNFLFIDLFCHGCPSLNLWKKYLDLNKSRNECNRFSLIEFRSKVYGWHEHAFKFKTGDKEILSNRLKNEFSDFFFNLESLNEACYECKVRKTFAYTDIRLGDFWGPTYDEDTEGVSAVIAATKRGLDLINDSQNELGILKEHNIDEVLKAQSIKKDHKMNKLRRTMTLELLNNKDSLDKNHSEYIKSFPLKKRYKIKMVKILKLLPQSIFIKIRKKVHKIF